MATYQWDTVLRFVEESGWACGHEHRDWNNIATPIPMVSSLIWGIGLACLLGRDWWCIQHPRQFKDTAGFYSHCAHLINSIILKKASIGFIIVKLEKQSIYTTFIAQNLFFVQSVQGVYYSKPYKTVRQIVIIIIRHVLGTEKGPRASSFSVYIPNAALYCCLNDETLTN